MITGSNKYKFLIQHDGTNWIPVGLVKSPVISAKKDEKSFRWARKSSTWKMVRYENATVYDALKTKITTPSLLANEILVKIELWDNWTTLTETVYQGYVPISGIAINEDNGVLELTPTEKSDYDWYDQHKGDKHDVYNEVVGTIQPLTYQVTTTLEEYLIPNATAPFVPTGFDSEPASISQYDAALSYVIGYYRLSWAAVGSSIYHCISPNSPSNPHKPGTAGAGAYWELLTTEHTDLVDRVFRQVGDLPFTGNFGAETSVVESIQGNGVYDIGFPIVTEYIAGATNCPKNRWYYESSAVNTFTMTLCGVTVKTHHVVSTGANHKLMFETAPNVSILEHLLGASMGVASHYTPQSTYFTAATNPLSLAANKLTNLRLVHNRVVKGIQDTDTSGEMTLEGLLNDICETFQCGWSITGTTLQIEHVEYFENGLTYPPHSADIYTDLTNHTTYPLKWQIIDDIDGTSTDKEYKFSLTDCPETETFIFPDGYDYNGQIKYDSKFVKKGEVLEHNISTYMTDFAYVIAYRTDSIDDSWCLIACDNTGLLHRRTTGLRWVQTPITVLGVAYTNPPYFRRNETNYPNGDLMWDNLLNDWWDYQCIFSTGQINGRTPSVSFNSHKRIKKQREIRFPRLAAGAFDPTKLITTNAGNGRVETFEIDTDTDFIKVELLYEEP
jgi:hypothetical protein